MISSIVKLSVSDFVLQILRNDAARFEFLKSGNEPNLNGLLNKLIPNLVYERKMRRLEIHDILKNEYARDDTEKVYECVNTVIDRVYFSDEELDCLDEVIWFRPSRKRAAEFDEIEDSETKITGQSTAVYIRGLLNEYCRLPQYKRESVLFGVELGDFLEASSTGKIFHAVIGGRSARLFAFHYVYQYTYDQQNYLTGYDLTDHLIEAIPLYKVHNSYIVEKKYNPSSHLISALQKYFEESSYEKPEKYEEKLC